MRSEFLDDIHMLGRPPFSPLLKSPALNSPLIQAWLCALWVGVLCNWPLWQRMWSLPELEGARGLGFILVFMGMVTALTGALLSLLAWPGSIRPAISLVLLSSAAIAHFMGSYGVVMDPSMMVNLLQTDVRETRDLLNLRLLLSFAVLAGLPMWWLWRRPSPQGLRWAPRLARNLLSFAGGVLLMVALILVSFADLASTMRNHKSLRYMITPVNAYFSLGVVFAQAQAQPEGPPQAIGLDARLGARAEGRKPPLMVLVVGETARAANFSLLGYDKPTTPLLQAQTDLFAWSEVMACGTSTAASLPCMFSPLGRDAFVNQKQKQESLLDVLNRAGLAVIWVDNQSGCKGVCDRIPNAQAHDSPVGAPPLAAGLCDGEECLDEALLHGLDERLAMLDEQRRARGVVLVLHQMGNHGPAYYKRSPQDRKPFLPECRSNALQQCKREELLNAYDNGIAYTDLILHRAIQWLGRQQGQFEPSLLYVSDHGESLGENNLYLHGLPYAVAPKEQKHVPLLLWLPQTSQTGLGLDGNCLRKQLAEPRSHDNLFHTTLSLTGVQTQLYRKDWDLLAACRRP